MEETITCGHCGKSWPATIEYWKPDKRMKNGLYTGMCRFCNRIYSRNFERRKRGTKPKEKDYIEPGEQPQVRSVLRQPADDNGFAELAAAQAFERATGPIGSIYQEIQTGLQDIKYEQRRLAADEPSPLIGQKLPDS